MNGEGFVALDWLFFALCLLAMLIQAAVLRSRRVQETPLLDAVRSIKWVSWLLLSMRSGYVLLTTGDMAVPLVSLIPLLLLAFTDAVGGLARLFPDRLGVPKSHEAAT